MFHLEEKTLKFFIFVRFHHVVGRLLFFSQGFGPKGPEKRKRFGMIWLKRLTAALFFIYNAKLQGFTLERGVTHAENLPAEEAPQKKGAWL